MTTVAADEQLRADMWNVAHTSIQDHRAWQRVEELAEVLYRVAALDPKVVVEIGCAWGGTLYAWRGLPSEPDVFGVTYGDLYGPLAAPVDSVVLEGDSHDRATLQRLKDQLGGRPVDVLFIDGDHTPDGIRADWEMYSPLVRAGGVTLFHDIACPGEPAVGEFWRALAADLGSACSEVISRRAETHRLGFGIVQMAGEGNGEGQQGRRVSGNGRRAGATAGSRRRGSGPA